MSAAGEKAYWAKHDAHVAECAALFAIGTVVYRAGYDTIEEGVVRTIERGDESGGTDPNGKYVWYGAQFGSTFAPFSFERQTAQYKWFATKAGARKALARQLRNRIEEKRTALAKAEALLIEQELLLVADPAPWLP